MGFIKSGNRARTFAGAPPAVLEAAKYSSAVQAAKSGFGGVVPQAAIKELERKKDAAQRIVKMNKKSETAKKSVRGKGLLASSTTGDM